MEIFKRWKSEEDKKPPELAEKKSESVGLVKQLFDRIGGNLARVADVLRGGDKFKEGKDFFPYAAEEFAHIKPLIPKALRSIKPAEISTWQSKGIEKTSDGKNEHEHLEMREPIEGGEFFVQEDISREVDLEKQTENYSTELRLIDAKNGVEVNLNVLLPPGHTFIPTSLQRIINTGPSANLIRGNEISLHQYSYYTTGKINEFSYLPLTKAVYYGNLTEEGGRLSLFHEISHAWQRKNEKRPPVFRRKFKELSEKTKNSLNILSTLAKEVESGKVERGRFEELVNDQMKELEKIGTKIPVEIFSETKKSKPTEYSLQMNPQSYGDSWVPLKNEAIERSLKLYEAEERDAWANALRLLRALREAGFEPEPSLKDIDAVRNKIQPCLASYEESMDIRSAKRRALFTKRIQK